MIVSVKCGLQGKLIRDLVQGFSWELVTLAFSA